MPKNSQPTNQALRHNEYYDMQDVFDELYARAKEGEEFTDLVSIMFSPENIKLAYRNIKNNHGSHTPGVDGQTIEDIKTMNEIEMIEFVRKIIYGVHGYRPKPVKRVEIPKPNGSTRPLGIPCIWDRIIQQCIKQVMEPICEAQFSDNSYGFRPNRGTEHAIAATYHMLQLNKAYIAVEFDIKGFFDNVCHSKLIKQIWALNIHDKRLIWILKQILKAQIRMPDGSVYTPDKGTPQGGIISPLLANIVLNELDHWIESQWQHNPIVNKHSYVNPKRPGHISRQYGYTVSRKTELKEMYIIRYADDFRIFCKEQDVAKRVMQATTMWLRERLRLDISEEKTKITDTRQSYMDFLGFKIKVHLKGNKYVVTSHMCDKAISKTTKQLKDAIINIQNPKDQKKEYNAIQRYNEIVIGVHQYYSMATESAGDFGQIEYQIHIILKNRLGKRLKKVSSKRLNQFLYQRYGDSKMLRYVHDIPLLPIGYCKHRNPMNKKRNECPYTKEGRATIHHELMLNTSIMRDLMRTPLYNRSIEFADNRISLFSAQKGKCYVTRREFINADDIHCHHKVPKEQGGTDAYQNLALVDEDVHRLIHAIDEDTIMKYLSKLDLDKSSMERLNKLRSIIGLKEI